MSDIVHWPWYWFDAAIEAGLAVKNDDGSYDFGDDKERRYFEVFATLITQGERERCAYLCVATHKATKYCEQNPNSRGAFYTQVKEADRLANIIRTHKIY